VEKFSSSSELRFLGFPGKPKNSNSEELALTNGLRGAGNRGEPYNRTHMELSLENSHRERITQAPQSKKDKKGTEVARQKKSQPEK
jgi:hypothetical protein